MIERTRQIAAGILRPDVADYDLKKIEKFQAPRAKQFNS